MGIDVYLKWHGQTQEERLAQEDAYLSLDGGSVGYHGESHNHRILAARCKIRQHTAQNPAHRRKTRSPLCSQTS